jgi:acyl-CoA synthetase (AMP-forming)/AMP-acid ligase II
MAAHRRHRPFCDGELFVCGRAKDTIIINGRILSAGFNGLEDLDGVRRGRVVALGVVDPGRHDRVVVAVEAGQRSKRETLVGDIRRRIADQFGLYVDDVVCVRAGMIGRTTSGKVRRATVKVHYERGTLQPAVAVLIVRWSEWLIVLFVWP